jgi:hypothetical protein
LKLDGRLDHHQTARYRRSWHHHLPYSLFATGFADILDMDHRRDIWILLADRGCDFASWRVWAEQMKKCTPNSMFGIALRLFVVLPLQVQTLIRYILVSASIDRTTHCWSRPTIQQFSHNSKSYAYPYDYIAAVSNKSLQKLAILLNNCSCARYGLR